MKPELIKALFENDEVDFGELRDAINIANRAREILIKYDTNVEEMRQKLHLNETEIMHFLQGSYPYDLRKICRLTAFWNELDMAAREKKEVITFPPYKYSTEKIGETKSDATEPDSK